MFLDDFVQDAYAKTPVSTVLASCPEYSLPALEVDVAEVRRILEFGAGTYEHSISIPDEDQIHADHRNHRNNVPFANALKYCPYLSELFHGFQADKCSFRLLRRQAGTAYSLHDDRDAGSNIVRMQLPVITNRNALLLVQKDQVETARIAHRVGEIINNPGPIIFDYQRLRESFDDWFHFFYLEPGRFHFIDTNRVHTLINAGHTDRITLAIDLIRNAWLDQWLAENMTKETSPLCLGELPDGTWEWSALRHGVLCHPRIEMA
jgi:hypothetical protein